MLQLRETRLVDSVHHDVLAGQVIAEEGVALIYVRDGANTRVKASAGDAGEYFAGVSLSRNTPPAFLPLVMSGIISVSNTFALPRQPISGQLLVKVDGTAVDVVVGAPADATEVKVNTLSLAFFAGEAGKAVSVQMLYEPTVTEARSIVGDAPIGGLPSTAQSTIGVIKRAHVATNFFDAAADWSTALYVKTIAGGKFSPAANAAAGIPGVAVIHAPDATNPFLVLSLNVA
jgi:hypothetical protein